MFHSSISYKMKPLVGHKAIIFPCMMSLNGVFHC